ncbi:transglutaminase domain-containing protein [Paludicola sp. MB14-C6]|uniref:transglutaminase domain-containing protein n=1 Tax=Paludihabitans sp. MB14-C6 TaxID=3070656 RepID=UPI0027DDFDAB|nr:transglutaminase domain-containing protein [Paludicola sp. MB14-C6]WMJ24374.1 transglutaminase domain-containing protein [Paludicola sp. MB14-C6]
MRTRMRKKSMLLIVVMIIACLFMTSCSYIKLQLPEEKKPILEKYTWANEANSTYYFNQLDEKLKKPYKDIVNACLSLTEKVDIDRVSGDELSKVMVAIMRDYPGILWLGNSYTFMKNIVGKTSVKLQFTMTKDQIDTALTKLNQSTTALLQDISPKLPDDEKVLLAHDKLVETITYDLQAANQRNVYGGIVEKKATCEGYAKALQFLLLKMGIESTVVYGEANEPHAWNLVRLGKDYYWVDATFDDRDLQNGGKYLSREYMLITDQQLFRTHTISKDGTNWEIPKCDKQEYNYFVKNGTLVKDTNVKAVQKLVRAQAQKAIRERTPAFQIQFETNKIAEVLVESSVQNGLLDNTIFIEASKYKGVTYTGRTYEAKTNVITFLLEYKK